MERRITVVNLMPAARILEVLETGLTLSRLRLQLEERSGVLKVQNRGSSAVVVRVVPLVESWQRPPTNAPRAIPDWLDIFPISARVAPQVHPKWLSYCGVLNRASLVVL